MGYHFRVSVEDLLAGLPDAPEEPRPRVTGPVPLISSSNAQLRTSWGIGAEALNLLERFAPTSHDLAKILGVPYEHADRVYMGIRTALTDRPVVGIIADAEDLRTKTNLETEALDIADIAAEFVRAGSSVEFCAVRVLPCTGRSAQHSLWTIHEFVNNLGKLAHEGYSIPPHLQINLAKVTDPIQLECVANALRRFEQFAELPENTLGIQAMIETREAVWRFHELSDAAQGRLRVVVLGPNDLLGEFDVDASRVRHQHIYLDGTRYRVALMCPSGVLRVDGPSYALKLPHPTEATDSAQFLANARAVARMAMVHYENVLHSQECAYYMSLVLAPAQMIGHHAAIIMHYLTGAQRMAKKVATALEAMLAIHRHNGGLLDDPESLRRYLRFFFDAERCRALTWEEIRTYTGLTDDELALGDLVKIAAHRACHSA